MKGGRGDYLKLPKLFRRQLLRACVTSPWTAFVRSRDGSSVVSSHSCGPGAVAVRSYLALNFDGRLAHRLLPWSMVSFRSSARTISFYANIQANHYGCCPCPHVEKSVEAVGRIKARRFRQSHLFDDFGPARPNSAGGERPSV